MFKIRDGKDSRGTYTAVVIIAVAVVIVVRHDGCIWFVNFVVVVIRGR